MTLAESHDLLSGPQFTLRSSEDDNIPYVRDQREGQWREFCKVLGKVQALSRVGSARWDGMKQTYRTAGGGMKQEAGKVGRACFTEGAAMTPAFGLYVIVSVGVPVLLS